MKLAVILVAAGRGQRAGGGVPKQYRKLRGQAVITRTLRALLAHPGIEMILPVIHPDDADSYADCSLPDPRLHTPVHGGADRAASVRAGLEALAEAAPRHVLIHDAARPFVSASLITAVAEALDAHPAALPALPIVDALWRAKDGLASDAVARDGLWRAQTPQGFDFETILQLHRQNSAAVADDVTLARKAGLPVAIVPGDGNNFKITLPQDFTRAERLLEAQLDIRTGTGFDVHAFCEGNAVTLCGIRLPHDRGLKGHSDADVAMHAITDAIFGALAEGDIGQWFPPSDPQWKGAASEIFLAKAVERAGARGFTITHLDCTIICETPKIGPHAEAMRTEIARITGLTTDRVSVKATTSERLGFTGRSEGIAAMAAATLVAQ